jgi:hypothetical protein
MAARESGSPLFDRLVSLSSFFIPRFRFLDRKARNVGHDFELAAHARPRRHSRIIRGRQWDWRSLGRWTAAHISYFLPKRYTVRTERDRR